MKDSKAAKRVLEKLMERKLGSSKSEWESEEEEENEEGMESEDEQLSSTEEDASDGKRKSNSGSRHIEELKKVLGLDSMNSGGQTASQVKEETDSISSTTVLQVETKASRILGKSRPPPEVVCYKEPNISDDKVTVNTKKKRKKVEEGKKAEDEGPSFSMRKARHEVLRFGLTGFDKETQRAANVGLAIKLGARPPKNEFKNYKVYKEEQRDRIERLKQQEELDKKLGKDVKKFQKHRHKKEAGTGSMGLKMGRFDGGLLTVSQKEVERLKKKRRK